ncbi:hypothetical protein KAU55_04625, partial [Candidatus Bathyarchaeota archaeon]|nr:hypothetical protein [Candidatus Bathyarchaeota archaeon]
MYSNRAKRTLRIEARTVEKSPYVIDRSKLRRFDSKNIIFGRVMWDSSWKGYKQMYDEKVLRMIKERKSGYSR